MTNAITAEQVRHIGRLARIELTDDQADAFGRQLADIVGYFDKLKELDTDGVEPMVHALEVTNVLAADVAEASLDAAAALANAPDRDGDYFKVPKVIGDS
ncbi:MAG: Asp-tRNA(Asn)/Glu-tRNA(Gln) amidotransferase subunit GatC [Planctomycetota bacterium]|nr:Asp-tRNA(Asn)/Glu-tRNA(Gln) amidotransferase subunit GatC [Planctomycetota bacterium]